MFCPVDGVGFSSQFAGLANGAKRDCNLLNSDSLSSTVVTFPDPFSEPHKYEEGVDSFVIEVWAGVKRLDVATPVFPKLPPRFVIRIHDAMLDGGPTSSEITRVIILLEKWNRFQEAPCGSGKAALKRGRKTVSGKSVSYFESSLNQRDAASAISLSLPAIEIVSSGEALQTRCRTASTRKRRFAT